VNVDPGSSFGHRLKQLRLAAGLSQEELADRAGLTTAAIGALERGERRHPYPHTLRALAEALGLSREDRADFFASVPRRGGAERAGSKDREPPPVPDRWSRPPAPLTPLVGRERDVAIVTGLFLHGRARLVTMTGPGGVGKTRLALEVANELGRGVAGGAVWVDLAPVRESSLALPAVAHALGLPESGDQPLAETLAGYLGRRQALLVLDNFEHLLAVGPALPALLERCPGLSILVTSREALHVRGEHEVQVPPLSLSEKSGVGSKEKGSRSAHPSLHTPHSDAVNLFLQRVRTVRPGFELTDRDAPRVAAICARLDGIPLAIELAAGQLKYMSPAALLDRLNRRLAVLDGGARDLPARQRSLRATVAWSHELLTTAEQALFRRLAVFEGGFTADAMRAICGAGERAPDETARTLTTLVDKSLVQAAPAPDGEVRFAMLETIRECARERLVDSDEEAPLANRHAEYFCGLAETAAPHLSSPARGAWLERLDAEAANLRAALAWTTTGGDPCVGLRLAGALGWYWILRGYVEEGRLWTDRLLAVSDSSCQPAARAGALYAAAAIAWKRGDLPGARRHAEDSVNVRRALADRGLPFSLAVAGLIATSAGDLERARRWQEESLALFRGQEDGWGTAYALANLGDVLLQQGDVAEAERRYGESLEHFTDVDDPWGRGIVLHALGNIAWAEGDAPTAGARFRASVALFRTIENRENIARSLIGLAAAELRNGTPDEARRLLSESLTLWRDLGSRVGVALCLAGLAAGQATRGRFREAAQLFGAADAQGRGRSPLYLVDADLFSPDSRATQDRLDEPSIARAWAEGQGMTLEQAVEHALAADDDRD
jgi:predicted ATPase/transcriptional regulator with XRE-family HTH domain